MRFLAADEYQALTREAARRALAKLLSERYRAHEASGRGRFVADPDDARAYTAMILPQSFAQISGALSMIPLRAGDWQPRRVLDIGAGPGTTAWAVTIVSPLIEIAGDP